MITSKTCLVLGAGASAPYGLPPATALRDLILAAFVPDVSNTVMRYSPATPKSIPHISSSAEEKALHIKNAWRDLLNDECGKTNHSIAETKAFQEAFFRSKFQSIDRFLQWNSKEYGGIGRICLAAVLLACEQIRKLDKDWYSQLLQDVIPNKPDDLMPGMLSVVTFNYDRSFERFFLDALEAGFRLRPETARSVFDRIDLLHVYGDLGSLEEIPYGDLSLLHKSARNIKLLRMQSEDENRVKINKMLAAAQNVCFIGFSFAAENVALFDMAALQGKKLVATSLGMSGAREQEVRKTFRGMKFFDGTADELLNNQNIFEGPNVAVPKDHLPVKPRRSNWMRDVLGDSQWRVRLQ